MQWDYRMTVIASVTITSFYAFLLNNLSNGLVTHYYKSKTKADLRMKVNDGPSHVCLSYSVSKVLTMCCKLK
jgi:hypothetical protein